MKNIPGIPILLVALQQFVFWLIQTFRFTLIGISWWVISVPIWLLWALYFVAPLVYERPLSPPKYVQSLAFKGWLFILASAVWNVAYFVFSKVYGVPISSGP